jgi:glycine/D-amino acid oxidase-like deaminating enzyme
VDVLIVGGGVVGNSIAFHLTERGVRPTVVDKGFPLSGTSGSTQAWIWVHTKTPGFYGELSLISADLYQYTLAPRLPGIEYTRTGGLALLLGEGEMEGARTLADAQRAHGIEIELLGPDELRRLEPNLSPSIAGATFSPQDGNVNPFQLVRRLMEEARRQGTSYRFYERVLAIREAGRGRTTRRFEVHTDRGVFRAQHLVLAAGIWTPELADHLSVPIPVRPVRGQILITEPLRPVLGHTLNFMRQMSNGEILFGYSHEEADRDRQNTGDILSKTAARGLHVLPLLRGVRVVRAFAGLRPMPADGLPILGEVPGHPGLFVAVMHSGYTLAPLVGTVMAELLIDGKSSIPIGSFSPSRFQAAD